MKSWSMKNPALSAADVCRRSRITITPTAAHFALFRFAYSSECRVELSGVREPLHHGVEANAALADESRCFRDCAFVGVGSGETDPDLMAAEHRPRAFAWRVLVIDELALPATVGARVGADVIEKAIASPHQAVVQKHDAGVAAIDTVEHPDVNGIKTIADAASGCNDRWGSFLTDRCHHPTERNPRQLH